MTDLDKHGNRGGRWNSAPKPKRFDEMTAAAAAGDTNLFEALKASYLREECGQ